MGGIQFCVLGGGWQVALRYQSVTHEHDPAARGSGGSRNASLGPTWDRNLCDRGAQRPRASHRRHDKRQQRLDDRKFLTVNRQPARNVKVHGPAAVLSEKRAVTTPQAAEKVTVV